MKFIKGARTWRSILGTQTFFLPLTPPPPPPVYYQPATKQRPGPSYGKVLNQYGPHAYCSLAKAVACTQHLEMGSAKGQDNAPGPSK